MLQDKVLDTINEYNMLKRGDKVIVAVSGGPDSMCLLHVLYSLQGLLNLELIVAHVNHCLRGEEADADERYVKDFCEEHNIKVVCKRVDVHGIAEKMGVSCETAGREERYKFFNELIEQFDGQKIAIAHNANDQAETVLMRVVRGTGTEGLVGIKPVRENLYIRPLIKITRKEIEGYCRENSLEPRIDKTNLESIFTRNKIRLELIPYLQKNFNVDVISAIDRLASNIKEDNDYLEYIAKEKYKNNCEEQKYKVIIYKEAFLNHKAILSRIIRLCIGKVKGNLNNVEKIHIEDIINLQRNQTGKRMELFGSLIVENVYGDIHIIKSDKEVIINKFNNKLILGLNYLSELNMKINLEHVSNNDNINFNESSLIKYFDLDLINDDIVVRIRENGDRFCPIGMKGSKKLKDIFIDMKIPRDKRDTIPLICFGEDIAWIVGYKVSEKFKITSKTKNILKIVIQKEGSV